MVQAAARRLIFRLGEVGFILDIEEVVEICEQLVDIFNPSLSDVGTGIIGALNFRRTQIPVVDPALQLKTHSHLAITQKSALVLKGEDGNWALLVDRVEEILPADKFQPCEIPPLLKKMVRGYSSQISLLHGEPMIHFESGRCRGELMAG